jgi:hypothetical protein
MTTTVFSAAKLLHSKPALVCQLSELTPREAIDKLSKAGVLAIEGPESDSIVLLGFSYEVSKLVTDLRLYGYARKPESRFTLGKLRKLSLVS